VTITLITFVCFAPVLSISTADRRKASANSLKEVGDFFLKIEVFQEGFLSNLIDAVGYSTHTRCLLQILLKPLTTQSTVQYTNIAPYTDSEVRTSYNSLQLTVHFNARTTGFHFT